MAGIRYIQTILDPIPKTNGHGRMKKFSHDHCSIAIECFFGDFLSSWDGKQQTSMVSNSGCRTSRSSPSGSYDLHATCTKSVALGMAGTMNFLSAWIYSHSSCDSEASKLSR
mmetsp:Transcript_2821/g.7917  ORF Transcript_2821/g.7917 Transcript_2821/m.7917 type:complete len:112 (-) Transcript_2821:115-450(-)